MRGKNYEYKKYIYEQKRSENQQKYAKLHPSLVLKVKKFTMCIHREQCDGFFLPVFFLRKKKFTFHISHHKQEQQHRHQVKMTVRRELGCAMSFDKSDDEKFI